MPRLMKAALRAGLEGLPELRAVMAGFGDRLRIHSDRPLMVGVSGGGDSVALLLLLWLWGHRRLVVGHVDHGLQAMSGEWAQGVADLCAQLGVEYIGLKWANPALGPGVSRAARLARHRLLADAARKAGAGVICLGQNLDDAHEAAWMRVQGSSVGSARLWAPSPVWPEGRDLFLYRPLIGIGRQVLRDWLRAAGVAYIDDPANDNPKSLRARARQALLTGEAFLEIDRAEKAVTPSLFNSLCPPLQPFAAFGAIVLDRKAFLALPTQDAQKVLSVALVCVGGGERLPDKDRIAAACETIRTLDRPKRTLSGARMLTTTDHVTLCRDASDRRNDMAAEAVNVAEGQTIVWEGRFEITAGQSLRIVPNDGRSLSSMDGLSPKMRAQLKSLPRDVRLGMPLLQGGLNPYALWIEAGRELAQVRSLCPERMKAALGLVHTEADIPVLA